MWIILFFACASVFPNNAQEVRSYNAQTVAENQYANNGANWDSTRPPVVLTVRNGRTENSDRSANENSNLPVFYSNHWQPLLMPIGFNSNGDTKSHSTETEHSMDDQFAPTFLRRPDTEMNYTVPYDHYSQPAENNEFSPVPVPLAPIFYYQTQSNSTADAASSTIDKYSEALSRENTPALQESSQPDTFYGSSIPPLTASSYQTLSDLFSNSNNFQINKEEKEIPSEQILRSSTSSSETNSAKETVSRSLSTEQPLSLPTRPQPIPTYRNIQSFMPPMIPSFYPPYPFLPFSRDGMFQPFIPYPRNDPNFDRETGSEVPNPVPQRQVVSENSSEQLSENIPSETSTDIVPPQTLPFGGFPFGVFPPPYFPPLIPNIPRSRGLSFSPLPLPPPTNIPKGNVIVDNLPPPSPIPARPLLDVIPAVIPQTDIIGEEARPPPTDVQVKTEETIINEKLNAVRTPYEFGFDMNDGKGTDQHRKEVSDILGVVTGSYGYKDAIGVYRIVNYIADKNGFRAFIKSNEPGVASSGSADVVVMAEQPPPQAIAEGLKVTEPDFTVISDATTDLLTVGGSTESK